MWSLTDISVLVRKSAVFLVIFIIAAFFLKFIFGIITAPKPLPPPKPDTKFGKLPALKFSQAKQSSSGMKFFLENVDGKPPNSTSSARVFRLPKKLPSLLSTERTKDLAIKMGFKNDPVINSSIFHFVHPSDKLLTFDIDPTTFNFKLKYDYTQNPEAVNIEGGLVQENAINEIKNYLQSFSLFDGSILNGKSIVEQLKYIPETKSFSKATSISNTTALKINFFRNEIDNLRLVTPGYNQSYNYLLFTRGKVNNGIVDISYIFSPIAFDDFATYPLKTSDTAWQDLLDGYGFIMNLGNNSKDKIVIRKIEVGYYDSDEPQEFLQPIFIFEGDNDFVAYLPAVISEVLE